MIDEKKLRIPDFLEHIADAISRIEQIKIGSSHFPSLLLGIELGKFSDWFERSVRPPNQLHKKITVWAGGHVRREDGRTGIGAITKGAIRELQEELRIYATPSSLKLLDQPA